MFWSWLKNLFAKKVDPVSVKKPSEVPKWYTIAEKEIGIKEVSGSKNNPRIVEYQMATSLKATDDETPWCSAFACWCLESAGVKSTRNSWARSYLDWGIKLKEPKFGCIVVFSRGPTSGHVGFWVSGNSDTCLVLGGNQADSVCISEHSSGNVLGYRWPNE